MRNIFVLSKVSRRGVHGVACDLLRVVCRVRGREVREAMRGRISREFSGYLVSGNDAELWRDPDGRVVQLGEPARWSYGLRVGFEDVLSLDAPYWLPAGGMYQYRVDVLGNYCAADVRFFRDGWAS